MAKLNLSSMKTADLRSVAPIEEGARPSAIPYAPDLTAPAGPASQPVAQAPAPQYAPQAPLPPAPAIAAVPAYAAPQAPVFVAPAPVQQYAAPSPQYAAPAPQESSRPRISLIGNAAPVAPAPQESSRPRISLIGNAAPAAPAQAAHASQPVAQAPAPQYAPQAPLPPAPAIAAVPAHSAQQAPVAQVPAPQSQVEAPASEPVAEPVSETPSVPEVRAPIEGVHLVEAAKVVNGGDSDRKADEIIHEALTDDGSSELEKKAAAVEIPDAPKTFFPGLVIEQSLYEDEIYSGIVPERPTPAVQSVGVEKSPEVAVAEEVRPVAVSEPGSLPEVPAAPEAPVMEDPSPVVSESVQPVKESADPAPIAESAPEEALADSVGTVVAAKSEEADPDADAVLLAGDVLEPSASAVSAYVGKISGEYRTAKEYVLAVAKRLSAQRRDGGLAKLYGERKTLVRAVAGAFLVSVMGIGAFAVSGPVKTSGPEALNSGTASVAPVIPKHSVNKARKVNRAISKPAASGSGSASTGSVATGSLLPPASAAATGAVLPLPPAPAADVPAPQPVGTGAAAAPAATENPPAAQPASAAGNAPAAQPPVAPAATAAPPAGANP